MRLEVGSIAITELEFGPRTELREHRLIVNRDEIRQLVLEDSHFSGVEVELARPGESIRIINSLDVVEPRWKVAGPGGVFPGFVSPPTSVGEGRTHRLAGVAVVEVGEPVPGEPTHFRQRVIDMAGPGAQYSPFGTTLNVVLEFKPNPAYFPSGSDVSKDVIGGSAAAAEYNHAITAAGLKVAAYLGRTSREAQPDDLEVFELPPCDPGLPKVVCLSQHTRATLYGISVGLPLGTLLHPNEFFDGALVGQRAGSGGATYLEQNNDTLVQLCRHHGKDLNLLGCIVFGDDSPYREEKERVASAAAKLARVLGANGAVVLGINGSNYAVDTMLTIQNLEHAGIKTTLIYFDMGYGPDDTGFVFAVPEADAIVSTGSRDLKVTLPPLRTVIGGQRMLAPDLDPSGEITVLLRQLHSSTAVHGHSRLTTRFV